MQGRHHHGKGAAAAIMISDFVYDLCQGSETVTTRVAVDPRQPPGEIAKRLFSRNEALPLSDTEQRSQSDLKRALECGKWGDSRPSDVFLKVKTLLAPE